MNLKNVLISAGLVVFSPIWLHAAIEFVGVSTDKTETKVALVETSKGATKWVRAGEQFDGYSLVSYDEAEKSILLTKDGTELRVKLKEAKVVAAAPEKSATESTAAPAASSEYIIKAGDNASKIARNAGLALADLQSLNPGVNWSKLHVGQKIRIQ